MRRDRAAAARCVGSDRGLTLRAMPRPVQLTLLVLAPVALFFALIGADRLFGAEGPGRGYVVHLALPRAGGQVGLPRIFGPPDASRPLVVIDAGHGGHDPGAGVTALKEKVLTLALAQALRDRLVAGGGIRVALTRDDDRYLLLGERAEIARRLGADLFLSIHADSADNSDANGATVYTLSDKGSDQEAERIAARENGADTVNGVALKDINANVDAILVDLSLRGSLAGSNEFAGLIRREGTGVIAFRPRPQQAAAFAVLKSPDVPSVLFEAGYISNTGEAAQLNSRAGRAGIADALARAIRVYFARHSGAGGRG